MAVKKTKYDLLVEIINTYLADATIGLAALEAYVDLIDDATNGLAAIKAEVEGLAGAAMRGTDGAALAANLTKYEHEVEWASIPVVEQVADAAATSLTDGTIIPTYPSGATRVRAILIATIHAANYSAATHHIDFKIQGKKDAGLYVDQLDLTAQDTLGLVNLDGAADGWSGAIDVTTLVDASASTYLFKFIVDSDNAGAVNYTTGFVLVLVYKI